jgi:hypothetical protein
LTLREINGVQMFENRVLRVKLGAVRVEAMGNWREVYNEKLNDLYSSPNIMCMIKTRRLRWAGHVACTGEKRNAYRVWVGKPEERGHLEGLGIEERIILKWMLKKQDGKAWAGLLWLSIGTSSRLL